MTSVEKEGEHLFAFNAIGKFNLKNFEAAIPVSDGANMFGAVVGSETGYRHPWLSRPYTSHFYTKSETEKLKGGALNNTEMVTSGISYKPKSHV